MIPPPVALGLTLCDYVLVEENTRKLSLFGIFTKMMAERFPYSAPQFFVHSSLTDGIGDAAISLVVSRLDTSEVIARRDRQLRFTDKLRDHHLVIRMKDCAFPVAGGYQFALLVDGEWVAQRRLTVVSMGAGS